MNECVYHCIVYECPFPQKQGMEPTLRAFGIGSLCSYHICPLKVMSMTTYMGPGLGITNKGTVRKISRSLSLWSFRLR